MAIWPHEIWGEDRIRQAARAVHRAIARGDLSRPDHCHGCQRQIGEPYFHSDNPAIVRLLGLPKRFITVIEAHHHVGYAPGNWLSVQWLCRPCHRRADAEAAAARYREAHGLSDPAGLEELRTLADAYAAIGREHERRRWDW